MNLKELSKLLGLSQTTVSRAINGYPEVSESTRQKVQDMARAHNYSPNARAHSLATGQVNAIGHVIPIREDHEMLNPVFGDIISGIGEVYAREGFDMLLSVVPEADELGTYRKLQARSAVDGVMIHTPLKNDPRIELAKELGLPFVVHGRSSFMDNTFSWLDVNNFSAFNKATELLLDLGHTRVGLINGIESMDFAYRRREGYLVALRNRGISVDENIMRSHDMTENYGYTSAMDMLQNDTPPSAFLVASIITASGVHRAIEELGYEMGRDISVVSFDDDLRFLKSKADIPAFTCMRSSVRKAGRELAKMLLRQIKYPNRPLETMLIEAELVMGRSTGPFNG